MKKMSNKYLSLLLALALALFVLTGCGTAAPAVSGVELADGGVLHLRVNPEIDVAYDEAGNVTAVTARNDDAARLLEGYTGYEGRPCREVVTELVSAIGQAGYFVEEVEGESRQITIEIEAGSQLPHPEFLDEVVSDVRQCVSTNSWHSPVDVQGESDYGMTDYVDTDYGPENDGVTDYNDTDYGPNNDGVTDYNDTDYGPNNDGVTDYNDDGNSGYTAPAPAAPAPAPETNDSGYGDSAYTAPAPAAPAPAPAPAGDSGYDDGGDSGYDDGGDSGYDDGGDSGYDD